MGWGREGRGGGAVSLSVLRLLLLSSHPSKMPSACYSLPRGCSPWRPLLLLSLAVLLVVVLHALRNELIRRQVQFSAEVALSALVADGAAVVASAVLASTGGAPSPSVAEFTRLLSANEKKAWLQTPRYTSRGYQTARLPQRLRKDLAQFHAASRPAPEGEGERQHAAPARPRLRRLHVRPRLGAAPRRLSARAALRLDRSARTRLRQQLRERLKSRKQRRQCCSSSGANS